MASRPINNRCSTQLGLKQKDYIIISFMIDMFISPEKRDIDAY